MLDDIHAILDTLKLRHARAAVAERLKAAQKDIPSSRIETLLGC